jgi:hypothetical protein
MEKIHEMRKGCYDSSIYNVDVVQKWCVMKNHCIYLKRPMGTRVWPHLVKGQMALRMTWMHPQ